LLQRNAGGGRMVLALAGIAAADMPSDQNENPS
jgi:hypothetical protein